MRDVQGRDPDGSAGDDRVVPTSTRAARRGLGVAYRRMTATAPAPLNDLRRAFAGAAVALAACWLGGACILAALLAANVRLPGRLNDWFSPTLALAAVACAIPPGAACLWLRRTCALVTWWAPLAALGCLSFAIWRAVCCPQGFQLDWVLASFGVVMGGLLAAAWTAPRLGRGSTAIGMTCVVVAFVLAMGIRDERRGRSVFMPDAWLPLRPVGGLVELCADEASEPDPRPDVPFTCGLLSGRAGPSAVSRGMAAYARAQDDIVSWLAACPTRPGSRSSDGRATCSAPAVQVAIFSIQRDTWRQTERARAELARWALAEGAPASTRALAARRGAEDIGSASGHGDVSGLVEVLQLLDGPTLSKDPAPVTHMLLGVLASDDPLAKRHVVGWLERSGPTTPLAALAVRALLGQGREPAWDMVDRLWSDPSWRPAILRAFRALEVEEPGILRRVDPSLIRFFSSVELRDHALLLAESALQGEAGPTRSAACGAFLGSLHPACECLGDIFPEWLSREIAPLAGTDLEAKQRSTQGTCGWIDDLLTSLDDRQAALQGRVGAPASTGDELEKLRHAKSKILSMVRDGGREIAPRPTPGCCEFLEE